MDLRTTSPRKSGQLTENRQQTLYFTLSLYADQSRMRAAFGNDAIERMINPEEQVAHQRRYAPSQRLRDAIEPLLNDITSRERESDIEGQSHIEDYFLASKNGLHPEAIAVKIPATLEWVTEGMQFSAEFDGGADGMQRARDMKVRMFWYVHANGAVSYHMSFIYNYKHTIADFFFISMLQKACAPKEFRSAMREPDRSTNLDCLSKSGLLPLDKTLVSVVDRNGAARPQTFWNYVSGCFEEHARDLFGNALNMEIDRERSYFKALVGEDAFIEVPGLKMPRARYLFLFHDKNLFADLRRDARNKVNENHKECSYIQNAVAELIEKAKANDTPTVFSRTFLKRMEEKAPVGLRYHFASGFCQNIIDFMNQDAGEIRDSLDPIYPTTREQEEENFSFRFANPRSLFQFVGQSRSLNIGNDYIGTCPYEFLVHVASAHNEFLIRAVETDVSKLRKAVVDRVGGESVDSADCKAAATFFYEFRTGTLAHYARYRYENVFRYDSEGDCFKALERVRGIERKTKYLNEIVDNLERTTRDLEERQREKQADALGKKTQYLNWLVAGVGTFSILQVLFQVLDLMREKKIAMQEKSWFSEIIVSKIPESIRSHDWAGDTLLQTTFFLSSAVLVGFFLFVVWVTINFLIGAFRAYQDMIQTILSRLSAKR
jgi:hypothetical protein